MIDSGTGVEYRIDAKDRIIAVNSNWADFARENDGVHLLPPGILGTPLLDSISEPTTRTIYRALLGRVRKGAGSVRFLFRCDSPGVRRLLDMGTSVQGDAVIFRVRPVAEQEREAVLLLDPTVKRSRKLVVTCRVYAPPNRGR